MDKVHKTYTADDGDQITKLVPKGTYPPSFTIEGKVFELGFGPTRPARCDLWPKESPFLSCTPPEVEEFREVHKEHGVAIEFRDDGMAVVGSKPELEKAAALRHYGVC